MKAYKNQLINGFTLVELIISIIIIAIIVLIIAPIISNSTLNFNNLKTRKAVVSNNALIFEKLSQDINFIYDILSTDSKSIQFTTTSDTNLILEYKINNDNTMLRKAGASSYKLIAQNIEYNTSQFMYFDSTGNIGSPIHRIRLYLINSSNGVTSPITMDIVPYTFR